MRLSKRRWSYALILPIVAALGFVASSAMATDVDPTLNAKREDVRNTKHNLAANPDVGATGTSEPCVFCHTPHGGTTTPPDNAAPLWNRRLPAPAVGFTMYTGPNFEGATDVLSGPKGVSLACLSCHDGTIALDALVNVGGSGGLITANLTAGAGGTSPTSISFIATGIVDPADSTLYGEGLAGTRDATDANPTGDSPYSGGMHDTVGTGAALEQADPFPNLTQNLSDDHPISMRVPQTEFGATSEDPQFNAIGSGSTLDGGVSGTNVMFIRRSDASFMPTDKRDRLRAYASTALPGNYYIECASCHNPHTPRVSFLRLPSGVPGMVTTALTPSSSAGNPDSVAWGRRPNSGSAICLSCHEK